MRDRWTTERQFNVLISGHRVLPVESIWAITPLPAKEKGFSFPQFLMRNYCDLKFFSSNVSFVAIKILMHELWFCATFNIIFDVWNADNLANFFLAKIVPRQSSFFMWHILKFLLLSLDARPQYKLRYCHSLFHQLNYEERLLCVGLFMFSANFHWRNTEEVRLLLAWFVSSSHSKQ